MITNENTTVPYVGDGSTTVFAITFDIFEISQIKVEVDGVLKLQVTDYTVDFIAKTVTFLTAPLIDEKIEIYRKTINTQDLDYRQGVPFPSEAHEKQMDRQVMMTQENIREISEINERLPKTFTPDKILVSNPDGDAVIEGPDVSDIVDSSGFATAAASSAAAAAASATSSASSAADSAAQVSLAAAQVSLADSARIGAEAAESNAMGSELAAAASAADALAAAQSSRWQDVVPISAADSPVNIEAGDTGNLYKVDTSAGAVVFNLPARSDLNLSLPWQIGIIKKTADINTVTVNPDGVETIDGIASVVASAADTGYTLVPDDDTDDWTSIPYATTSGGAAVTSVAGKTGDVTLVKADVGLANVDNTSDANKPVSTAQQTALNLKANTADLASVATSGDYNDLLNAPNAQYGFRRIAAAVDTTILDTDRSVVLDGAGVSKLIMPDPALHLGRKIRVYIETSYNNIFTIRDSTDTTTLHTINPQELDNLNGTFRTGSFIEFEAITSQFVSYWVRVRRDKNLYQYKFLPSVRDTNGAFITFNNLVVGQLYEITGHFFFTVTGDGCVVNFINSGQTLPKVELFPFNGTDINTHKNASFKFVATNATLTLELGGAGAADRLFGNGGLSDTWAMLEEINNSVQTAKFT